MDRIDKRIISLLQQDAGMPAREIAEKSQSHTHTMLEANTTIGERWRNYRKSCSNKS